MADSANIRTVGDIVREARKHANLTLRELASRISVHYTYISDVENDRRIPSEQVLRSLAAELEIDFDELMAMAGRFGELTERYLKRHPTAGLLIRRIADAQLTENDLKKLLRTVDKIKPSR